jgi:hypothetical protein
MNDFERAHARQQTGVRPHRRTSIVGGLLLAVFGALMLSAVLGDRAGATPTHTVDLVAAGDPAVELALQGQTFDDVLSALATDTAPTIALPVAGFDTIADVPVLLHTDSVNEVIALGTEAPLQPASLSDGVLGGVDVELMLTIDWDATLDGDTDPVIALGIKAAGQALSDLYPAWAEGPLPGLPDDTAAFTEAILSYAPDAATLDPAAMPAAVSTFYGLDGPLDETVLLDAGSGLLAELDLGQLPAGQTVADFLGIAPDEIPTLSGTLADTAALLFDDEAVVDPNQFSLDGPFEVTNDEPTWLQRATAGLDLPEFRFRIGPAPDRVPTVELHDEVAVTTGGVTNVFEYDFSLHDGADLNVTAAATTFHVPFGLDWMGPFTDVELNLFAQDDGTVGGAFEATVPITAPDPPRVRIAVKSSDEGASGEVSVDGDVPLADLVTWAGSSSAFPGSDFDDVSFDDVVVNDLELTFEGSPDRTLLSVFATASGIQAFDANLSVAVLVAIEDTPTTEPTLVFALTVKDPGCDGGSCIALHKALPLPGGSLAADLTVPAVNLGVVQPKGAGFDPEGLGTDAMAFLETVLGHPPVDPVVISGDLELSAEIRLAEVADPLSAIGVAIDDGAFLRVASSLEFTLSDFASLQIDAFELVATFPDATAGPPPGLPAWIGGAGDAVEWSTDPWEAFLRFEEGDPSTDDDDVVAFGATLDGITTTLTGEPPVQFGVEVEFEGTPATGDWTARLRGTIGEWQHPFGIDWLVIDSAALEIEVVSVDGDVLPSVLLTGTFDIAGYEVVAKIDLAGVDPFTASLTLTLGDVITAEDVITKLFGNDLGAPAAVLSAGVGPGEVTVRVTSDGEYSLGGTMSAGFSPFGQRIGACAMFHAEYTLGAAAPQVAVGVSPEPLKLSQLLPDDIELPVDFDLVTESPSCGDDQSGPDDSGVAFVYSTFPALDPDDPALAPSVRDWFAPLYGGAPGPQDSVPEDLGVLGSFAVPAPLDEMLQGLGIQPNVLLSGAIPLPTPNDDGGFDFDLGGLDMSLGLRLRDGLLPDFVDGVDLKLRGGITLPSEGSLDAPSLSVGLEGTMTLKLKQGVEPALADSLAGIGLELPVSDGTSNDPCPRGGFREPGYAVVMTDPGDPLSGVLPTFGEEHGNYCYDLLALSLGGELAITPPRIEATLTAGLSSLNDQVGDDWGWAPLGFDEVLIRQLGGQVTLAVDPSTAPFTLEVKLGLLGNFQLLDKDVSGAIQAGIKIDPVVAPPKPPTFVPIFDGLRISLPDGFGTQDLLNTYAALEEALRAAADTPASEPSLLDDVDAVLAAIPDVEVRNLFFSISPFGVSDLCIDQGLILRGDLYIDPDPNSNPMPDGLCVNGEIQEVEPAEGDPAPPSGLCVDRQHEGCFAGVNFSLTPSGIIAEGSVAGFEVGPFEWQDSAAELRLTFADQYIKLRGGAYLNLPDGDRTGGEMTLQILPTSIRYYGHLEDIFGFDATVEGSADVDPLALFTGDPPAGMRLRVVVASDEIDVGPGADGESLDYAAELEAEAAAVLAAIQQAIADIQALFDDLTSDPIGTLARLTAELNELGVESGNVPPWASGIVADIADWAEQATKNDSSLTSDDILNGPSFPGVPAFMFPEEETCASAPFGVPLLTIEFDPDTLEVTVDLVEGVVSGGKCWTVAPSPWNFNTGLAGVWVQPTCVGIVDGGCWLVPPFNLPNVGLCDVLDLDPCSVDELWDEHIVDLMGDVLDDAVASFGATSNVAPLLAQLEAVFDGQSSGPLLALRCAEFEGVIGSFDDTAITMGMELALAGEAFGLAITWDFSDFDGSVESLVGLLFAEISPFTCQPLPEYVTEDPFVTGAGGPPGGETPPPANLSIAAGPLAVSENGVVTLTGTFDRALTAATVVTIDWGDGTQTVPVAAGATTLPAVQHTYRDDDPSGTQVDVVTISATPDNGGAGDTARVTVRNVAPSAVVVSASPAAINEGGLVSLDVSFSDPGPDDIHTVVVNWGDGTLESFATGVTPTHTYLDDDPTATSEDVYTVTVTVRDDDRGIGIGSTAVTVRNVAPSNVAMTWPGTVDEGAWVPFTVTFDDVGTRDVHQVQIDWGGDADGFIADTTRRVSRGARSVVVFQRIRDDDPTGTPSDVIVPAVRVVDDDGGTSPSSDVPVEVSNVAPTFATSGLGLRDDAGATITGVDEDGVVTLVGGFSDPGVDDTHIVTIDWGDGSTAEQVAVVAGQRDFTATHRYLDDNPSNTSQDDYTIAVTITDDDTGFAHSSIAVTVRNVDPAASVDVDTEGKVTVGTDGVVAVEVQYSDPIADGAGITVRATDVAGDPLTASVQAGAGGSTALAEMLSVAPGDCTADIAANSNSCTWVLTSTTSSAGIYTDLAPGTYAVQIVVEDDDLGSTEIPVVVTVLPEDARVWYTGPLFAATESALNSTATVELRATIRDITSVPDDPAWDPWPGDVRNASLTFEDRDTDQELCGATAVDAVFDPFDVFVAAQSIGVGTCPWTSTLGDNEDAVETTLATIAGGHYTRDEAEDDAVVTIARPLDDFITGGGYLVATDSAGVYASSDGTHANYGFHVKFNKRGTNLQGGVNLIVRSAGRVYQIKANAMESLGVHDDGTGAGAAEFESKANITDVTDPDAPFLLGGNFVLQMRMTDLSEDDGVDTIGFSLWDIRRANGNGGRTTQLLLYSSNWSGNVTHEQRIAGGNLMVHA